MVDKRSIFENDRHQKPFQQKHNLNHVFAVLLFYHALILILWLFFIFIFKSVLFINAEISDLLTEFFY